MSYCVKFPQSTWQLGTERQTNKQEGKKNKTNPSKYNALSIIYRSGFSAPGEMVCSRAPLTVHRTYCKVQHGLDTWPLLRKITRHSFTVLNICHPLYLIQLAGHARPNTTNPKACGVCARFPFLSVSAVLPSFFSNGSYESSLHPVVWKAALS